MRTQLSLRTAVAALVAGAVVAACGSSNATAPSRASASSRPAASSPGTPGGNAAMNVALGAIDLPSNASGFTKASDGLLGSTPGTDARVFSSADGKTKVEVDLAVDTGSGAASTDYSAYQTAAKKQVPTLTSSSSPPIGSKASEYLGTDSMSRSIVSVAFVQGSVIGVVTMVSAGSTVDAAVAEAIASTQVQKIAVAGL
jgi:K+-transporting ATPase c subunit